MKKIIIFQLLFFTSYFLQAQVGINTTNPDAQLDIRSSNQVAPSNTDGILIPKIDTFPAANPTAAQQGMLVYLTTTSGTDLPGFYYWDNTTTDWKPITGTSIGTLDQAYDFGGAGNGRTITADTGAVLINGTDGFISTGILDSGSIISNATGDRMFWYPRKGAFRVGRTDSTQWDDVNIGQLSSAFGYNTISSGFNTFTFGENTTASGLNSTAFGVGTSASGNRSTAFGSGTTASGLLSTAFGAGAIASGSRSLAFGLSTAASEQNSTAFGEFTNASGYNSFAFGSNSIASGSISTSFGYQNSALSFGETVLGIGATTYTTSVNGSTQFRTSNRFDRLFAIGNAIDSNNNSLVDTTERSDALVVFKDGRTGIGTSVPFSMLHVRFTPPSNNINPILTLDNNHSGSASNITFRNSITNNITSMGMLSNGDFGIHQGCNFGGCGLGVEVLRIKPNGNVGIGTTNALEKFHVVGNIRMEDGNQAAGRVLTSDANGTATWSNPIGIANGTLDQAYDFGGVGSGRTITADAGSVLINGTDGLVSTGTTGVGALAPTGSGAKMFWNPRKAAFRAGQASLTSWDDINIGINSIAMGFGTRATGNASVALGNMSSALGMFSVAFGTSASANATQSVAFGNITAANSIYSTAFGYETITSGRASTSFGVNNEAESFGEVVLGIGATSYIPSTNGVNQFRSANATDRLFVVGNAIDVDNDDVVDTIERSDAMIVLKNGLTRLPSTTNVMITAADGKAVVTKEYLQSNNWSLTGNTGTNPTSNFIGTTDDIDLVFRRNNVISGRIGDQNTFFGKNSGIANTGVSNTFIGERSGIANISGDFNTFFGRLSGANGVSGSSNTYVGYASGLNNTGLNNVIVGAFAAQNTSGNSNTFIGERSGSTNTLGARNVLLGDNADVTGNNLTNATAIGSRAEVGASNSLVLGSINGVNGATSSVNVGIGTTTPARALHVATGSSGGTPNGNGDFVLESNGTVYEHLLAPSISETGLLFGSELASIHAGIICNNASNPNGFQFRTGGNTTRMVVTNAGDVGIGTVTPGGQFQLSLDEGRKPGTSTWTIASDQRLKTINGNYNKGLNEILQLNPIRFNYKNVSERVFEKEVLDTEFAGFIAQEVQPLFPDAVGTDEDGFLNFNIHPILIAQVNAIKELDKKNNDLQKENNSLKIELENQKVILEQVLQRLKNLEKNN